MYAARKIRESFRANKSISNFDKIDEQIQVAHQNLKLIRRQVVIGHLYSADKLVIEEKNSLRSSDD